MDVSGFSVGVVIRTNDRPFFVPRALASVTSQLHKNWHIVLVNDGGDPELLRDGIAHDGVMPIPSEQFTVMDVIPGKGRSQAFNSGVEALQTDFVTCLDDDDTWDPEFMSALLQFFAETAASVPDLGGVGTKVTALKEEIVGTGKDSRLQVIGEDALPPAFHRGEFFLNALAYSCYRQDIYPVQWMMRRQNVRDVGGFPVHFDVMEDRAFMNLFLARWRIAILDRKLAYHHRRVQRGTDNTRNVLLNTLDNPSYDWRFFADLARPTIDYGTNYENASVVRSIASDLLAEVNYETSAIWQKVDGEMRALHKQLADNKAELQAELQALAASVSTRDDTDDTQPPDEDALPHSSDTLFPPPVPGATLFDIWSVYRAEHAQYMQFGEQFAERLQLSCSAAQYGLMLHAAPEAGKLVCQLPETQGWAAIEISLAGLVATGAGVQVRFQLESQDGYLFETALMGTELDEHGAQHHQMSAYEVHSCDNLTGCIVTRRVEAAWLDRAKQPRLVIILPRNARNFRFICRNLIIEQLSQV